VAGFAAASIRLARRQRAGTDLIQVGQQMLCIDSLNDDVCYVEAVYSGVVDDVSNDPAQRMGLKLSDGSSVNMPRDHPLGVHFDGSFGCKLITDLEPQKERPMCLRVAKQTVQVEHEIAASAVSDADGMCRLPRHMCLTVKQGERSPILESPAGCDVPLPRFIAAGVADGPGYGQREQSRPWLHCRSEPLQQRPCIQQSLSDPTHVSVNTNSVGFLLEESMQSAARQSSHERGLPAGTQCSISGDQTMPLSESFASLVEELTQACRPQIVALIMANRRKFNLDLEEFWSTGSELHLLGNCCPCGKLQKFAQCERGQDCAFCHIPHEKCSARPNKRLRARRRRFSEILGGLLNKGGDDEMRLAVHRLASQNPHLKEMLQEHIASLRAAILLGRDADRLPTTTAIAAPTTAVCLVSETSQSGIIQL